MGGGSVWGERITLIYFDGVLLFSFRSFVDTNVFEDRYIDYTWKSKHITYIYIWLHMYNIYIHMYVSCWVFGVWNPRQEVPKIDPTFAICQPVAWDPWEVKRLQNEAQTRIWTYEHVKHTPVASWMFLDVSGCLWFSPGTPNRWKTSRSRWFSRWFWCWTIRASTMIVIGFLCV